MFLHNAGPRWAQYLSSRELIETVGSITLLQMGVAYTCLFLLVPKVLNRGHRILFVVLVLLLLLLASEAFISFRYFYLEIAYETSHAGFLQAFGHMNYWQRLANYEFVVFVKMPLFAFPACVLTAFDFYQKQQKLLALKEQKKTAELLALKRQLNPHFLFNTLNNLYALALKKSDLTPVAIEKISAILDYMLYRCEEKFVSLRKEVEIMEDYIQIEKIRYGKRLSTTLNYELEQDVLIAPLLLLNLVENACKHSTKHELDQAKVEISIQLKEGDILMDVKNTKPPFQSNPEGSSDTQIGLKNLQNQLALIYPETHQLQTQETETQFEVNLRLRAK